MSDFLNTLIANWTETVKAFAALAAITLIVVVAIVTKLAWGKIIVTMIVAGAVVWAVTMNGLGWFSEKIDSEMRYLQIAIDKTAGADAHEAWSWLQEAVAKHRAKVNA